MKWAETITKKKVPNKCQKFGYITKFMGFIVQQLRYIIFFIFIVLRFLKPMSWQMQKRITSKTAADFAFWASGVCTRCDAPPLRSQTNSLILVTAHKWIRAWPNSSGLATVPATSLISVWRRHGPIFARFDGWVVENVFRGFENQLQGSAKLKTTSAQFRRSLCLCIGDLVNRTSTHFAHSLKHTHWLGREEEILLRPTVARR